MCALFIVKLDKDIGIYSLRDWSQAKTYCAQKVNFVLYIEDDIIRAVSSLFIQQLWVSVPHSPLKFTSHFSS